MKLIFNLPMPHLSPQWPVFLIIFFIIGCNPTSQTGYSTYDPGVQPGEFNLISHTPGHKSIALNWGFSKNATSYEVLYKRLDEMEFNLAATFPTPRPYTINNLINKERYLVKVTAKTFSGKLDSKVVEVIPRDFLPPSMHISPVTLKTTLLPQELKIYFFDNDLIDPSTVIPENISVTCTGNGQYQVSSVVFSNMVATVSLQTTTAAVEPEVCTVSLSENLTDHGQNSLSGNRSIQYAIGKVSLGSVSNKSQSLSYHFDFNNPADAIITCSPLALSGSHSSEFSVVSNNCSGQQMGDNSSCRISLEGVPQNKGTRDGSMALNCGQVTFLSDFVLTSLNNLPVTSPVNVTLLEDHTTLITLGPIADIDGDSLTYTFVKDPSKGSIGNCRVQNNNFVCDYSTFLNLNGADTFTFQSSDGRV